MKIIQILKELDILFFHLQLQRFQIPKEYEYPTVNATKRGYEQIDVHWHSKKEVDIIMVQIGKPRTVNNPFIDHFPLLKQLIKFVLN